MGHHYLNLMFLANFLFSHSEWEDMPKSDNMTEKEEAK